jgi:hypothetical protein
VRGTDGGDALSRGQAKSITNLAEQERVITAESALLPLNYPAPDVVVAILDGRQPTDLRQPSCSGANRWIGMSIERIGASANGTQGRRSTVVICCRACDSPGSQQLDHRTLGLGDRTGGSKAESDGREAEL